MDKLLPFSCRLLPENMEVLADLALDLRWTWNHGGDRLWESLDPQAWESTQNPWWILQSMSQERMEHLAASKKFKDELQQLVETRQDYLNTPGWFKENYPEKALNPVAYFSMEFGLGEALPLYAGGLGILAGDYLKTASDLNVPVIGIGLLYQEGYFRQIVGADGWQIEAYPHNDPASLPLRPVTDTSGGWLRIPLELPGRTLLLRVWQVQVGRMLLYLLDSNHPVNNPTDRSIVFKLYDDRPEFRLMQEMALGIGGWRVLKALGIPVEICHLNEGHAALVVLERARDFAQQTGQPFPVALWATRAGNVFTTHTPVAAGFDTFSPELIALYFRDYAASLGISLEQVLALGRREPEDSTERFNMSILAMRGSIETNGVSQLHGEVSRRIFQSLFPRWPEHEVPVSHVTNGVYVPLWDSRWADDLWTDAGGKGAWRGTLEHLTEAIQRRSDIALWALRNEERQALVNYVRQRLENQFQQYGADTYTVEQAKRVLDPDLLTIGFARRFTAYKRPNLLLHDLERLARILNHPVRPVQVIAAGKAHPQDEEGKQLVQQFVSFSRNPAVRSRIVFLPDYDFALAQELVQGVDLWLNTPRRPWEACGTSGMKVLVNGGLNLSELDGWWAEAYEPTVGWAIGDRQEHPELGWDNIEAQQLYELLEQQIIPEFYDRDARGVPVRWVSRIRASMSQLAPRFSSNRMLREYVEKIYLPATTRFRDRISHGARMAVELQSWQKTLEQHWPKIRFGKVQVQKGGDDWHFEVPVYLGELPPEFISVELYADPADGHDIVRKPLARGNKLPGAVNGYLYKGSVPATRPAEHFTARIIPAHPAAYIPLEASHILWHAPTSD
jgi:starch phosphorylase